MFRRGFFVFRLLGSLLLIAVLIAGGVMIFRAGQAQGYSLGAAAAAASSNPSGQVVPAYPNVPYAWPGYYGMHFFPFGPLLGLFFFGGMIFFVFFILGGLFRFRGGGHHPHHWKDRAEWAKHIHEQWHTGQPGESSQQPPAPPAA